ncbi:MAG: hypothetical protein RDU59_00800 [Thermodesulfobacteriota bacterium]|nr:hypothetical protein [Thermodesulfobacteriota bacterium]
MPSAISAVPDAHSGPGTADNTCEFRKPVCGPMQNAEIHGSHKALAVNKRLVKVRKEQAMRIVETVVAMADLPRRDTKLPVVVWIDQKGVKNRQDGPRVKITLKEKHFSQKDFVSITISDEPQLKREQNVKVSVNVSSDIFNAVRAWIVANKQPLLDFWNKKIDLTELKARARPYSEGMEKWGREETEDFQNTFLLGLRVAQTGLPTRVWLDQIGFKNTEPRIKVATDPDLVDELRAVNVTIDGTKPERPLKPSYLEAVKKWIALNKSLLIDYWYMKIDSTKVLDTIKKLS